MAREARAMLARERERGRLKFSDKFPGGAGEAPLLRVPEQSAAGSARLAAPPPARITAEPRTGLAALAAQHAPGHVVNPVTSSAGAEDPTDLNNLIMPGFEPAKRVPLPPPMPAALDAKTADIPLALNPALPNELDAIAALVRECRKCDLCKTRNKTVFSDGSPLAKLVFVGEAPGRDEDQQGLPFVGRAGQLLDKMIQAIDMKREEVYICNVLKCRPPDNRTPEPGEVEQCRPYLEQQLALIRPVVICALGLSAMQALLETKATMSSMRGKTFSYRGIPLIPTYHPAALLRNPGLKRDAWIDLQRVRDLVQSVG